MSAAFELKGTDGTTVEHELFMIRNPWDVMYYSSSMDWHYTDSKWTDAYISQVPNGINPLLSYEDGIFFVDKDDFQTCFQDFHVGHFRESEGYSSDWYDQEDAGDGTEYTYTVSVPAKSGDLYFTYETYYQGMTTSLCTGSLPI